MHVYYVPSHDAEYNNQAGVGVVESKDDLLKHCVVYDLSKDRKFTVRYEFLADIENVTDVVSLLQYLVKRELDLQHDMYVAELHADALRRELSTANRYHIN